MFSQKINLFCLFCFPSHSGKGWVLHRSSQNAQNLLYHKKRLPKTSLEFLLVFGFVFWFFVLFNVNTTFHFAVSDV